MGVDAAFCCSLFANHDGGRSSMNEDDKPAELSSATLDLAKSNASIRMEVDLPDTVPTSPSSSTSMTSPHSKRNKREILKDVPSAANCPLSGLETPVRGAPNIVNAGKVETTSHLEGGGRKSLESVKSSPLPGLETPSHITRIATALTVEKARHDEEESRKRKADLVESIRAEIGGEGDSAKKQSVVKAVKAYREMVRSQDAEAHTQSMDAKMASTKADIQREKEGSSPSISKLVQTLSARKLHQQTASRDYQIEKARSIAAEIEAARQLGKQMDESNAAATEEQGMREEAAAEEHRMHEEAAAAEEQRLQEERAAAEEQRVREEAAAKQQRLQEERAAAEEQQVHEEEAAAAEEQRVREEEAPATEEQRLQEERAAAEEQRMRAEAAAAEEQQRIQQERAATKEKRTREEAAAAMKQCYHEENTDTVLTATDVQRDEQELRRIRQAAESKRLLEHRAFKATLTKGVPLLKHSRNGKSMQRTLKWKPGNGELGSIGWGSGWHSLSDCTEVRRGTDLDPLTDGKKGTATLNACKEGQKYPEKSFSLIFRDRTLDFSAASKEQCNQLVYQFRSLLCSIS